MGLFGHVRIHETGLDRTPDTPTTSNTSTVHTPTLVPSIRAITTTTASSAADADTADFSCPHCPRTFTSRIGLVGHLRIHRTATGDPVPGAPIYTHQARLNCPHCPRTFRHRMGLFGHVRIHDDLRHYIQHPSMLSRSLTSSPCAPTAAVAAAVAVAATISVADTGTADFSCPHCPRTSTPRIGLVGHLLIHHAETGEPMPEAFTYTLHIRLHCPRTFMHHMGLFGHMRIHENLR
nr:unnamed protein product [Spirometra erinaceieuropaei]